jgi:trans-aconitate 2-methyltransferase
VATIPQGAWDPALYDRFKDDRGRPFHDLLALVEKRPAMRILDLGSGTGELTRRMHDALFAKQTLGIDTSAEMLGKTAGFETSGLSFRQADIASFTEGKYDLVFSNAALHWVPDHATLLARLTMLLDAGGQLAVQVPDMESHPSHATARELAGEEPFAFALTGSAVRRTSPVLRPEEYARLLFRLGYGTQTMRLQIYGSVLPGPEDVVEWVRGTLLTEYKAALPPALWERFLAIYRERLAARLEKEKPYFYPYRRILFAARLG